MADISEIRTVVPVVYREPPKQRRDAKKRRPPTSRRMPNSGTAPGKTGAKPDGHIDEYA